ncbi:hypothetical protein QE152_g4303 [Popillia japonica]|uniref:Uncharacterized protein n=1 Tax=Popillia japonica TaxID=7064 RepID=A0AAW1N0W8_POPJA
MASPVPAPRDLKNINVKTTHSQPNRPPRRREQMASPVPAPRDLKNINVKTTHSQPNRPPRRRDTVLVKKPPASTEQENSKRKNRAPAHLTLKIDAEYLKVGKIVLLHI